MTAAACDLRALRRRTAVAANVLAGLVGAIPLGAVAWSFPARNARKDQRAIWALHELHGAQSRFAVVDRDGDGRLELGTLPELEAAGVLDERHREALFAADHAYEVVLHPTDPWRWLAIAHPLRRGLQAYAYDGGVAVHASNDDIRGSTDCVIPAGCWQLGK